MILAIDSIRKDGGTQPRGTVNPDVIDTYQDAMEDGAVFPPVDVFYDGTYYWLADGFHRVRAKEATGAEEMDCTVHQGTVEDARWFSFGANKANGLYRSNADKQRAIKAALEHPKSQGLSDHQIADHCGVAVSTVGDWRKKSTIGNLQSSSRDRQGRDGRTINTANIGKVSVAELQKAIEENGVDPDLPKRIVHETITVKRAETIVSAAKSPNIPKLSRRSVKKCHTEKEFKKQLLRIMKVYVRHRRPAVASLTFAYRDGVPVNVNIIFESDEADRRAG
jgi:hypothetical protein